MSDESLSNQQIDDAGLTDWRKLAQALHARFVIPDYGSGAAFVTAVGQGGRRPGPSPRSADDVRVRRRVAVHA